MSHISAAVEYALHCLLYIVDLSDDVAPPSARDLADLRALPADYVATIMTKLSKASIVVTREGVRGGIRLARPAEDITFLDIVTAIDGEKPLFACRDVRHACALFADGPPAWATAGTCSIHAVMLDAEARMKDVLRARTLRHMAEISVRRVPDAFRADARAWFADRNRTRKTQPLLPPPSPSHRESVDVRS